MKNSNHLYFNLSNEITKGGKSHMKKEGNLQKITGLFSLKLQQETQIMLRRYKLTRHSYSNSSKSFMKMTETVYERIQAGTINIAREVKFMNFLS